MELENQASKPRNKRKISIEGTSTKYLNHTPDKGIKTRKCWENIMAQRILRRRGYEMLFDILVKILGQKKDIW